MKRKNNKIILILIIALILLMVNILIFMNKVAKPQRQNREIAKQYEQLTGKKTTTEEVTPKTDEEIATEELKNLKEKPESARIRYYLGKYLNCIEKEEYEKAYNILYPKFKQNYFQSLEKYEEYVKKLYPEVIAVECNDMQRQGKYYVLSATILDPMDDTIQVEQKFVIMENNYLDFTLSFQVI